MIENEPLTFKKAMASSKFLFWKEDANSEIEYIMSKNIFQLVDSQWN